MLNRNLALKLSWLLSLPLIILTGCRTLAPLDLPEETAYPPAQSELWMALSQKQPTDWAYLLNTGDEAIDWRLRLIDSATESIDLQTFLWFDDPVGLAVLHHLFLAADRGVRIRILLDDSFTEAYADAIWTIDHHPNIEFRLYNPYTQRADNMALRALLNLGEFGRVDHRMHNKCLIVDNRAAIVGGRNQADEYFGWHEAANFRDLELICHGQIVPQLSRHYDRFWNSNWVYPEEFVIHPDKVEEPSGGYEAWVATNTSQFLHEDKAAQRKAWHQLAAKAFGAEMQILADLPDADGDGRFDSEGAATLQHQLIQWISRAEEELIMVAAYLIPTDELTNAIREAEARGVEVKILTNSMRSNNHLAAHSAYRHHTRELVEAGADLHEVHIYAKDRKLYMNTPVDTKHLALHGKFLLIDDDISIVGSANLDPRSLALNTELNLAIKSKELNEQLREYVDLDFDLRNAWKLDLRADGKIYWTSDEEELAEQPHYSRTQLIENWILSHLPIESEM